MPQMQAILIEDQQLVLRDVPRPEPGPGELLVRVAYAGLNRADIFQREGSYPGPEGALNIPGLEISGTIEAAGEEAGEWREGDEVCALLPGGGYAEYAIAKAAHCLPIPKTLGLKEAAELPECAATVWMALMEEAQLQPGERVLIQGGASGVGTTAIQMLRNFGCEVWATAGSAEKAALCEQLGAAPIRYKDEDFVSIIKDAGGVDVALDIVGGAQIDRNLQCLRPGGRLVSLAFLEGAKAEVNAGRMLMKRLRWIGTNLRSRSDEDKARLIGNVRAQVWPWIEAGQLSPVIDSVFPLKEAVAAQEKMQKYLHSGKILLQVSS